MTAKPPGHPRLRQALRDSTSFVLALARCGRCTLTPAAAPALTGTSPGTPGIRPPPRLVRCKNI